MIRSQRFGYVVEDNQLLNFIVLSWLCRLSRRLVRNGRRRETPGAIDHRADLAPGNRQLLAALWALEFDRHGAIALTRRRMDDHSIGTCRPAGSKNVFKVESPYLLRQEQIIDQHAPTGHGRLSFSRFTTAVNRWLFRIIGSVDANDGGVQ